MPKHLRAFSAAVRRARGEQTQLEFAIRVGITPSTLSRWERGEVECSSQTLGRLRRDFPKTFDAVVLKPRNVAA